MRTHTATLTVTGAGDVPVEDVTLTADESWSPYVQADVVSAGAVAAAVDPYAAVPQAGTLTLTERDEAGTVRTTVTVQALSVRSAGASAVTGQVRVGLASGEARVQDRAYMYASTPMGPSAWVGIREAIEDLLGMAGVTAVDATEIPYLYESAMSTGVVIQPADYWWPLIQDMARRGAVHVWVGLDGNWRATWAMPAVPVVADATLTLGVDLEDLETTRSRDRSELTAWADGVAVVYEWTDTGGAHRIVGRATTAAVGGYPTKVVRVDGGAFAVTQAQANAAAAYYLARCQARGREYTVTIPARYDLRPRTFIDLVTPSGTTRVYVSRITWRLPGETATLTLRAA